MHPTEAQVRELADAGAGVDKAMELTRNTASCILYLHRRLKELKDISIAERAAAIEVLKSIMG
jgi:hypothetical protein